MLALLLWSYQQIYLFSKILTKKTRGQSNSDNFPYKVGENSQLK